MIRTGRGGRLAIAASLVIIVGVISGVLVSRASRPPYVTEVCARGDLGGQSVARVWDEQILALIRQVVPAPTVHARNLFHLSA
ncbi:MAG: hypothetical protein ABIP77_09595, partial [Candidatus Limnocylindrales bacterium]